MSNYQVSAGLKPWTVSNEADCFVAQGFIPAKSYAEFRMLYAVCLNLDIDHSLLDIGYVSFFLRTM